MKSAIVKSRTSSERKSTWKRDDNSASSAALIARFLRVEVGVAGTLDLAELSFGREIVILRPVRLTVDAAEACVLRDRTGVSGSAAAVGLRSVVAAAAAAASCA